MKEYVSNLMKASSVRKMLNMKDSQISKISKSMKCSKPFTYSQKINLEKMEPNYNYKIDKIITSWKTSPHKKYKLNFNMEDSIAISPKKINQAGKIRPSQHFMNFYYNYQQGEDKFDSKIGNFERNSNKRVSFGDSKKNLKNINMKKKISEGFVLGLIQEWKNAKKRKEFQYEDHKFSRVRVIDFKVIRKSLIRLLKKLSNIDVSLHEVIIK